MESISELLGILNRVTGITADDILSFTNVKPVINKNGGFTVQNSVWTLRSKIILNKGDVANLNERIETTIGRAVVNRLMKIDPFGTHYKYDNKPIKINDFFNEVTTDLLNSFVTTEQMIKLFNNTVWLTRFADMVLPSLSQNILVTPKHTVALKSKLVKENADIIANGDISYVNKVEQPVLNDIVDQLKDDPSFMLYQLTKPSIGNNLKQMIGTFSPIFNPTTGKYDFPEGNLMTGLDTTNYNMLANMNIGGAYSRAVETQNGGAIVKTLYNCMNTISAAPVGTDCGTTMYKIVTLTNELRKSYLWTYVFINGGLVLLTPNNISEFIGKVCYFRSPLFCKYEVNRNQICNKCIGELPYRLGLLSIGNLTSRVGGTFVQLSLKSFHDSTISLTALNPFDAMVIDK